MREDSDGNRNNGLPLNRTTHEDYKLPIAQGDVESILGQIGDAVFIFSVEHHQKGVSFRFQWNNAAHESITGMTIDEYYGLCPEEFLGEESAAEVTAHYRDCVEQRDTIVYEETLKHENDQIRWHTKLTPVIKDDTVVQIIGVSRDITDRMARSKHHQVVNRVFRHNVCNTLNVIEGRAEHIETNTEPPIRDSASQIIDASDDLLHTSEKARTIAEIIFGGAPVMPLRINSLLEQVETEFSETDQKADISISVPQSETLKASPRLSDAVSELIQNAIVHHDRPSPSIEVAVTIQESTIELAVVDDGPGIPEKERNILVDGQTPRELSHGIGLGMWMVYWIVHRSKGDIKVADRSPRGSVVTIRLPRMLENSQDAKKDHS